jgi:glycerol-3-phosphate dehydrogenase
MRHEWARNATDILWRRSKLGLHMPADTATRLDAWMKDKMVRAQAASTDRRCREEENVEPAGKPYKV